MASASVRPGWVLLTGGSSRGGRRAAIRLLLREQEGWRSVSVEPSADVGEGFFSLGGGAAGLNLARRS